MTNCDDAVSPDLYDEKFVKARKVHHCCECGHPIMKGEKYQLISGAWDGRWAKYKTCTCCANKRCALAKYFDQDCIPLTCLAEAEAEWKREQATEGGYREKQGS